MGLAANDNTAPDLPLAVVNVAATPTIFQVHTDHLGRPIRLTDAAKATVWQATYKPWGAVHATSGTQAQNLRFPGQYFQIETGLAYNWHRQYDPVTGRYTQPDPLRFVDGPSMYAYAGSSPFMKTDREGRVAVVIPIVIEITPAVVNGVAVVGGFIAGMIVGDQVNQCLKVDCEEQLQREHKDCAWRREETALPDMYAACMRRAMDRYVACRQGKSGPDPWSDDDEEVWIDPDR
jgi:RHS repeat-associated protein